MHIGVDATCWHNRRGYGRHARALLKSLVAMDATNRYTFFLDSTENAKPLPARPDSRLLAASVPPAVAASANDPIFLILPQGATSARLTSLGLMTDSRLITYVGGFNPHKNLEALVASFTRIAAEPAYNDVRLVMVGDHEKEVFHSYFGTISG